MTMNHASAGGFLSNLEMESMLLGFAIALAITGGIYGFTQLLGALGKWLDARDLARARERLIGADKFVVELSIVRTRRAALAPRLAQLGAHRDQLLRALDDFRGTQAEGDFQERFMRAHAAHDELRGAHDRLCELEANICMRRASWGLVRRVQEELSTRRQVSVETLQALRAKVEESLEASVDAEVRMRIRQGSKAREPLDQAQERLRNHLAALRLRQLDTTIADEARTEPLDALVLEAEDLGGFEEEMRELEAQTEAVLEVERMLA